VKGLASAAFFGPRASSQVSHAEGEERRSRSRHSCVCRNPDRRDFLVRTAIGPTDGRDLQTENCVQRAQRIIGPAFCVGASLRWPSRGARRRRPQCTRLTRARLTRGRRHGLRRQHIEPATTAARPKVIAGRAGRPSRPPIDPGTRRRSDVQSRGRRRRGRARRKGQGEHCKTAHANRERHDTGQES
jgi:hypothetical protein